MRMIRPYGRSVAKDGRRTLTLRPRRRGAAGNQNTPKDSQDLPAFARDDPHILIAQWISAIDKVIHKPKNNASPDLRAVRQSLGAACWERMTARHESLRTEQQMKRTEQMKKIWDWKLHPYGKAVEERRGREGPKVNTPRKGRWFDAFAGNADLAHLDYDAVAKKLEDHLYHNQRRQHDGSPRSKRTEKGLITARAESVEKSLPLRADKEKATKWTTQDAERLCVFFRSPHRDDPARKIWEKNRDIWEQIKTWKQKKERAKSNSRRFQDQKPPPMNGGDVGKIIAESYKDYFFDGDDVLTRDEIRDEGRGGELALWDAVRAYYRRLLKGKKHNESLNRTLPKDAKALVALLQAQKDNRRVNDLIRRGRLLHYKVDDSALGFDSEKQSEIKRAEGFARVWRTAISHAQRSVKRWVDPDNRVFGDILGGNNDLFSHFNNTFDAQRTRDQVPLLFGARAHLFGDISPKDLSLSLAYLTMRCRHKVVHFTSQDFVATLKKELQGKVTDQDSDTEDENAQNNQVRNALAASKDSLCTLFDQDWRESSKQIAKEVSGAKLDCFARQKEMDAFVKQLGIFDDSDTNLPKFKRVLLRLQNTEQLENLPAPEDLKSLYGELEHLGRRQEGEFARIEQVKREAILAKYIGTKMIYEGGPFRRWLAERDASELKGWLDAACDRATDEAREMNGRDSNGKKSVHYDLIVAKAYEVKETIALEDGVTGLAQFSEQLTALTASEMRVQNGYESAPENAKKQAKWIDNLLCDVIGRAFHAFLDSEDAACGWLLRLDPETSQHQPKRATVTLPPAPDTKVGEEFKLLYAVLHMIPCDDVSRLLHQFRKWDVLETKAGEELNADSTALRDVLSLYLRMSEAKFEGQESERAKDDIRGLFEEPDDFERVFPVADSGALLATQRGLRQIMRFGHLPLLEPLFKQHCISSAFVEELCALEESDERGVSKIARAQSDRKKLHQKLVKKKSISEDERKKYCAVLHTVTRYRDLSAQACLTNHLRLHSLMMKLWARLLDFAGLWERDCRFVGSALIKDAINKHKDTLKPDELWPGKSGKNKRNRFNKGESKLDDFKGTFVEAEIKTEVEKIFSGTKRDFSSLSKIRNALAHFAFRSEDSKPDDYGWSEPLTQPNFTTYVNDVRDLMVYDRKLKNAVSKSIIGIMHEEGFTLTWDMNNAHKLCNPRIETRKLTHLGDKKIQENMHNEQLVAMVSTLFGREKTDKSR